MVTYSTMHSTGGSARTFTLKRKTLPDASVFDIPDESRTYKRGKLSFTIRVAVNYESEAPHSTIDVFRSIAASAKDIIQSVAG